MDILAAYAGQTGLMPGTSEAAATQTQAQQDSNTDEALSTLKSEGDTLTISDEARELLAAQAADESGQTGSGTENGSGTGNGSDGALHVESDGMANGAAASGTGGSSTSVSTDTVEQIKERIEEVEEEIEQIEQEISNLEAKAKESETAAEMLKAKRTELAQKQNELAELYDQLAEAQG